jgi:hypothetical protein
MKNNIYTKINEFNNQNFTEQELLEMSNISDRKTGIEKVILWIGPNPNSHGHRIKVSNIPNKSDGNDFFTITIPDFKIIGKVNKSFIDSKKIKDIIRFIELNMDVILSYSNYEITSDVMMDNLKSII